MSRKVKVGIIGATGYVGMEMFRLLLGHGGFEVTRLASKNYAGQYFSDIHPNFKQCTDLRLTEAETGNWAADCDLVITALPHGISKIKVEKLLDEGLKVLDHSGDFRFREAGDYEGAYKQSAASSALLSEAVYGLPELYREAIKQTRLIANPGCYPTATILALAPLLDVSAINCSGIVVHATSGLSGAGRQDKLAYSYVEAADAVRPYGVTGHRHAAEIKQELTFLAGEPVSLVFTPQLAPMKRGMLVSTIAWPLEPGAWSSKKLTALYKQYYQDEPFVRVLEEGELPDTSRTLMSNFVDIAAVWDQENKCIKLFSALDNLSKGASAQAIQSLNVMYGFPETQGLSMPGSYI